MGLTANERRVLDDIAQRLHAEDPELAADLAEHGDGMITAERILPRAYAWPLLAVAILMAALVFLVPLLGGN